MTRLCSRRVVVLVCAVLVSASLVSASLCACGGGLPPISSVDLMMSIAPSRAQVAPGEAFDITVVRVWERTLDPGPWDDKSLSPLVLTNERVTTREDDTRIEETRTFRAFAFARKDVRIPAAPFVAKDAQGELRWVESDPLRLRVRSVLDPEQPGAPELPTVPSDEIPRWQLMRVGLGLLILVACYLALRTAHRRALARRAAAPLEASVEPPDPLAALADVAPDRAIMAAADAVRIRIDAVTGVPAPRRTSIEVLRTTNAVPEAARTSLRSLLQHADAVKYGQARPALEDAQAAIAHARTCINALGSE